MSLCLGKRNVNWNIIKEWAGHSFFCESNYGDSSMYNQCYKIASQNMTQMYVDTCMCDRRPKNDKAGFCWYSTS